MVTDRGITWGRSSAPLPVGLGRRVEHQAPVVGVLEELGDGEGHRPPARPGGGHQQGHLVERLGPLAAETVEGADGAGHDGLEHAVAGRPMARAKASTSSSGAKVPGTGRPDLALWPMVRDVEKPTAPAAMASPTMRRHGGDVLGGGVLVGRTPLPHHVEADGAVGDLGGDVDGVAAAVEQVEVLAEGLPLPPGHARR